MRASDDDRERVAERLRLATGEGRLLAHELEERLAKALRARTYGELDDVVWDLPGTRAGVPERRTPSRRRGVAQPAGCGDRDRDRRCRGHGVGGVGAVPRVLGRVAGDRRVRDAAAPARPLRWHSLPPQPLRRQIPRLERFIEVLVDRLSRSTRRSPSGGRLVRRDQTLSPSSSTARNASCGTSMRPTCFIRRLPRFCSSSSLRLRVMSPP